MGMTRDEIINGLEREVKSIRKGPQGKMLGLFMTVDEAEDIITLLKEQETEENRILKIVWDVLHSGVSTDRKTDQDWVYERIRNRVRPMYDEEPKQVGLYGKEDWYELVCVCPDCNAEWMSRKDETNFCPKCGTAVKWE